MEKRTTTIMLSAEFDRLLDSVVRSIADDGLPNANKSDVAGVLVVNSLRMSRRIPDDSYNQLISELYKTTGMQLNRSRRFRVRASRKFHYDPPRVNVNPTKQIQIHLNIPSVISDYVEARRFESHEAKSRFYRRCLEMALLSYLRDDLSVDPNDPWPNPTK